MLPNDNELTLIARPEHNGGNIKNRNKY